MEITKSQIVKENIVKEKSSRPTGSPPVVGPSVMDPATLISEIAALRGQMMDLLAEQDNGRHHHEQFRDIMDQLAGLNEFKRRRDLEAGRRDVKGRGKGTKVEEVHVRYFFVCLGGQAGDKCMKMHTSEGLRDLNKTKAWTHGNRWYCDCGRVLKGDSGIIVEISKGDKHWYLRSTYSDFDILDIRAMVQEQQLVKLTPDELHARLRPFKKCLVTHQAGGLAQFDSYEIYLTLPKFQWEEILQIAASME
jgi:hypothetical protein